MSTPKMNCELPIATQIECLKAERPFFEANYIANGGQLTYLKWDECHDGTGCYAVDWAAVDKADLVGAELDDRLTEHAEHVTGCLMSWVQCALMKLPPEGWVLAPLEPNEEQKRVASINTHSEITSVHAYRIMMSALVKPTSV